MATQYELGRNVEYAAMKKLLEAGWFVQRAPSSKGPADLVAVRRSLVSMGLDEVRRDGLALVALVNCKRAITECYPEDWNKTWWAAVAIGAIALMAGRRRGVRGVTFMRMVGAKGAARASQPWEPFEIGGTR